MIHKTEGVALRIAPFSKTSHVVTWLTPTRGKIAVAVKGAQRPKSRLLGQYDLFYTCELLFYERPQGRMNIMKECCPLKTRTAFRNNWRACSCASYLCDLVSRISPAGGTYPGLYHLISSVLDMLSTEELAHHFLFWIELKVIEMLGIAPQLSKCLRCAIPLSADF